MHSGERSGGLKIQSLEDVVGWLQSVDAEVNGTIMATFVIATDGNLLVAPRRSEHVACAGGRPVLSAGEMTFHQDGEAVEIIEVSNQSTGYCPEPESWPLVAAALDAIAIKRPLSFTCKVTFRLCEDCGERNLIKDNWFVCEFCQADLPEVWNFSSD